MKTIKLSEDTYNYMRDEYQGICLKCHSHQDQCEPDAENYSCAECGAFRVMGIENALIMGLVEITFED